jgi:hypothetical protein
MTIDNTANVATLCPIGELTVIYKKIEGIEFDENTAGHVSNLIEKLKLRGDFDVYPLPRMWGGKGEIRLAHRGPDNQHPKGRGVFAQIRPTAAGATIIRRRKTSGGKSHINLNEGTFDEAYSAIISRRDQVRERIKVNEKVDPNKPGTVQGGQFESNRRKH